MDIFKQIVMQNLDCLRDCLEGQGVRHNYSGITGKITSLKQNGSGDWEFFVRYDHVRDGSDDSYPVSDLYRFSIV